VQRIYLDNAATSFPKPAGVYEAIVRYGRELGASPGRGQYAESREGARLIRLCREELNAFLGGASASHVVFTLNTSDALNLAIKGVARGIVRGAERGLGRGSRRLVTTAMDHNSVLRPFAALAEDGWEVVRVPADPGTGVIDLGSLREALRDGAGLLAVNWVSNVTGTIQPIHDACAMAREAGVATLVDVAQGLGHVPLHVGELGADLVAFPGHKGLLGPQGTGGLYVRPGFEERLATTREGGTGSISELDDQPLTMPEKYEAGSHNTIGIVGLREGVRYLLTRGMRAVRAHEEGLIEAMLAGLRDGGCGMGGSSPGASDGALSGLRLLGPPRVEQRVGTFSVVHETLTPGELAMVLEEQFGILARAGIHCAPRAHEAMGTLGNERDGVARGALRMSLGPFVTRDDVVRTVEALREVCDDARGARVTVGIDGGLEGGLGGRAEGER
jgi:selenocysteine lyase/cysteine desulfurase